MNLATTPAHAQVLSGVLKLDEVMVYNMLITTLFLLFVLTTVALLIFLLMRRPPCCPCCQDPYDTASPGSNSSQSANITYLTETHGIVVKKWMKDSPPPYESPPEYSSLSPELIMDAKTLQDLVTTPPPPPAPPQLSSSNAYAVTAPSSSQPIVERSSSPLCTTPLFSASFCDSPRSLTPTMQHDGRAAGCLYEHSSSPIFTHYTSSAAAAPPPPTLSPSSTTYIASSVVTPTPVYGQVTPSPPSYESLQQVYCHDAPRRKVDSR